MHRQRTTGFTVIEMLVTMVFVVLICGLGHERLDEYCQICGKKRTSQSLSPFRQLLHWTSTEKLTEFSRLCGEYVSPTCSHLWQVKSRGWGGILIGGISCDTRTRKIFMEPKTLDLVRRLHDRNKIQTIIANCDVRKSSWPGEKDPNSQGGEAFRAFDALAAVKTKPQENAWWLENRHLFVKK